MRKGTRHTPATRARMSSAQAERRRCEAAGLPLEIRHGTISGYCNSKCHCRPCKDAWSSYMRFFKSDKQAEESLRPVSYYGRAE